MLWMKLNKNRYFFPFFDFYFRHFRFDSFLSRLRVFSRFAFEIFFRFSNFQNFRAEISIPILKTSVIFDKTEIAWKGREPMALWPSVMRVIPLKCTRLLLLAYTSPSVVFSPHRTVFEAGHISHYFSISTFKRFEPVDYIKSKFRGKLDSLWRHNSWRHQFVVPWSSGSQESTNLGHVVVCVALLCGFRHLLPILWSYVSILWCLPSV